MEHTPSLPRLLSGALVFSALSLGAFVLAPSAHAATVTVRPRDTLSKLFPSTWAHVCRINGLANCDRIYVGQRLNDGNGSVVLASAAAPVHRVQAAPAGIPGLAAVVGKPYVWGGNGPYAFDCSGLMVYLARQRGIALPRTSQAQAASGRPIGRGELLPGDLVLMNGGGHVGMYIGGGQIVHALNPAQGVQVMNLDYALAYNPLYSFRALGR